MNTMWRSMAMVNCSLTILIWNGTPELPGTGLPASVTPPVAANLAGATAAAKCLPGTATPCLQWWISGRAVRLVVGSGARFPGKYQKALFILDWTYGTMYAIHLTPDGSSYAGEKEEFVTGVPLNLTDAEILPDGAMYFAVGGRRTPSGLYRVTYTGAESTEPVELANAEGRESRALRHGLELFHRPSPQAVDAAWPNLGHEDRFIRFAARVALEHQPTSEWQDRALAESDPDKVITLAMALARQGHRSLREKLTEKLNAISFADVDEQRRLEMLRAYQLVIIRRGPGCCSCRETGCILPEC
jgi:hypothetical protein